MKRLVCYNSGITAIGTYCAITAANTTALPSLAKPNVALDISSILESGSLYCSAATGTTGGVVVPVMLGADGNYYPLAAATTLTAAGFGFLFQMATSVIGLAIQVTTTITGGSVYLSTEALQV